MGRPGGRRGVVTAAVTVNRVPETVGYNLGYLLLAVGLGVSTAGRLPAGRVVTATGYFLATLAVRMAASVVDAVHDRAVDAGNPGKSPVAAAVDRLGVETAWSLAATEATVGLVAAGVVAATAGGWVAVAVGLFGLLGFWYSYPPRLKERGVANHVVTTGADVGLVVVPAAYLVAGRVTPAFAVVAAVVFLFTFGYHVVHQAADTHYDRDSGVQTFTTRIGVPRALGLAAVLTAASAGLGLALGYPLVAVGCAVVTASYVRLYREIHDAPPRRRTDAVASRFRIAWVAGGLNAVTALAVWRHALGLPAVRAVSRLLTG